MSIVYYKNTLIPVTIIGFLLYNCVKSESSELEKYLPAYAVASQANILSDSKCKSDLEAFQKAVDQKVLWSLKVLDASGEPKSGFFYGNNFWLGSKSQCLDLENTKPLESDPQFLKNASKYRNIDEEFPPFRLNYFIADLYHNNTLQYHVNIGNENLILLGLCLPASCSANELEKLLKKVLETKILIIGNLYSSNYRLDSIRDDKIDYQWLLDWKIITTSIVLILTILLATVGTLYDCIVYQKREKLKKALENLTNNVEPKINTQNILSQILLCFSLYTNFKNIFDTKLPKNSVSSICGIRLGTTMWICALHTLFFLIDFTDNRVTMWRISEKLILQVFTNAFLAVDTFFCLGGFLISWSFFNKKKDNQSNLITKFPWATYSNLILKRFFRIAPVYFIVIGITEISLGWLKRSSIFIFDEDSSLRCSNYWWRNVLFINNFFPPNETCMLWSWYLADDMQFYIIGTFLLLLSDIYFYTSAFILMVLLIATIIANGLISYSFGYTATIDQSIFLSEVMYTPPWMRIGPYLIGMITGYILVKINGKLDLSKKTLTSLWIIGSLCNILTLFGLYGGNLPLVNAAIYAALSKIVWSIGISWILIACQTNNAGIVNKMLSLKLWIPLSKITYCTYLLNPLVIVSFAMVSESSIHVNFFQSIVHLLGLTALTFDVAFIATIAFELPYFSLYNFISRLRLRQS